MKPANIARFVIIGLLWLMVVGYVLTHAVLNFFTLFAVVASGICVFVPMIKKYNN